MLIRNLVPETLVPDKALKPGDGGSAKSTDVNEDRLFQGEAGEGQGGTVPFLHLRKDVLDKTGGLSSPAWPGHRA